MEKYISKININDTEYVLRGQGGVIDTELSDTSTNAVQNKVIKTAFDDKADKAKLYTVSISDNETWESFSDSNLSILTKTVEGIKTTDNIIVSPDLSNDADAAKLQIDSYKCILNGKIVITADNTITIFCYEDIPSTALTLNILATY